MQECKEGDGNVGNQCGNAGNLGGNAKNAGSQGGNAVEMT